MRPLTWNNCVTVPVLRVHPAPMALLKECLVDSFTAWSPAAQTSCWAVCCFGGRKNFGGGRKKYYSLSSRSSSYMDLCVCRNKYCWELTILCLCIWSTSNDWRLDLQLELSEVTPIFMEIHHIALCSLSSSIDRGIWLRKNLRLYSRCCLVCAWNRWGGTNRHL